MIKKVAILFLTFFISYPLNSQEWIRTYGDTISTYSNKVIEHYDHGYLLLGRKYIMSSSIYGWILKANINGYERWVKMFGDPNSSSPLFGIDQYPDGGLITIGQTSKGTPVWAALVIKLNACGEIEWCRKYQTPNRHVYGLDIQRIPGGGSIAMVGNWGYDYTRTLWLLGLNDFGDIIWEQAYCTDTIFWDPEGQQLFRTHDTAFIITGYIYSPDSGQSNPYKPRPMLIRVKPDGTALFELAWGTNLNYQGYGQVSTDDSKGNIYSAVQQLTSNPPYCGPGIIKTSCNGSPLFFKNLVDSSIIGGTSTINWFNDSTLVMGIGWRSVDTLGSLFNIGVMKTDSFGNGLKYKQLIYDGDQQFNDADITFDNKLIIVYSDYYITNWLTKAFKLNSDLEYDSVYSHPLTYDSLCPYPIVSDTVPLDGCELVVVGVDEARQKPETTKLKVYPNPSKNKIIVEIPKCLVRKTPGPGITATTIYHQWNEARLEVFDLFGRLMYSEMITQLEKTVEIDVSDWQAGMYVVRIVFMNEVVASQKFLVE